MAIRIIAIIFIFWMAGCTGIGYLATSDPYKKLGQANSMMAEDRTLLAEDVIGQAMKIFVANGDKKGMAWAYLMYGNLYKNYYYHNGKWTPKFEEMGTYDGTYMKSIHNFEKAQELFDKEGDDMGVVNSLLGIGNAYGLRNERAKSCDYYQQALSRYRTAKQQGKISNDYVVNQPNYSNIGEMIEAFIKKDNCVGFKEERAPPAR